MVVGNKVEKQGKNFSHFLMQYSVYRMCRCYIGKFAMFLRKRLFSNETVDYSRTITAHERLELVVQLDNSLTELIRSIDGLETQQLYLKRKSNHWSIADCIEHVTLAELYFDVIRNTALEGTSSAEQQTIRRIKDSTIRTKMLSRIWRAKSPEVFQPTCRFKDVDEALEILKQERTKLRAYVETTQDDMRHLYWYHPLTGQIDLYQTLLLLSAHLERHVYQIKKIKRLHSIQAN
ncbi:MAG: DinB family protein [Chitinophagales bacterium]|nr:DinB family protein [Chitinophagales bacterium]